MKAPVGLLAGAFMGFSVERVAGIERLSSGRGCLRRPLQPMKPMQQRRYRPRDYSTTLTIGCVLRVRYSSSSCVRLVAVTVIVTPR